MGARPLAPDWDLDPKASRLIRSKAAKLSRSAGFAPGDREDLRQELALHVTAAWGRFDPARASAATFADRVLARKVVDLARAANAAKRDRRRRRPLDAVPEGKLLEGDGSPTRLDPAIDVREAVAGLPPYLRRVAELLMTRGVAETARASGLSRQQVRTARRKVADSFAAAGLGHGPEK